MAKVKVKRKSTTVDMTAMCDVAFLLLTFFMLATSFKAEEPVVTVNPESVSDIELDDKDIMLLTIGPKGRVFFGMDNPKDRLALIEGLNNERKLGLSPEQMNTFANGSSVGVGFRQLKQLLSLTPADMHRFDQPGIPIDTTDYTKNELTDWINQGRLANGKVRIAIKADKKTPYPYVEAVIKTFEQMHVHKFNLVTNPEAVPEGTALWREVTKKSTKE